jgi:hypothetical protein
MIEAMLKQMFYFICFKGFLQDFMQLPFVIRTT